MSPEYKKMMTFKWQSKWKRPYATPKFLRTMEAKIPQKCTFLFYLLPSRPVVYEAFILYQNNNFKNLIYIENGPNI